MRDMPRSTKDTPVTAVCFPHGVGDAEWVVHSIDGAQHDRRPWTTISLGAGLSPTDGASISSFSTESPAGTTDFVEVLCDQARNLHIERCRHPTSRERIQWNITANSAAVYVGIAGMVWLLLLAASFVLGGQYSFPLLAVGFGFALVLLDADEGMMDFNELQDNSKVFGF